MDALNDLLPRLEQLNQIGAALSDERDIDRLLENILLAAKAITHADGGTLYRVSEDQKSLHFEIVRTNSLGLALGAGGSVSELVRHGTKLAEGVHTASVAVEFAAEHGVELPITAAVADVVAETLSVDAAIERLMSRPLKRETA